MGKDENDEIKEEIRTLISEIRNDKESVEIRIDALKNLLSKLIEKKELWKMITPEDIRNFIKIVKNDNEDAEVREKTLNILSHLVEKGGGMTVIRIFLDIVKNEIEEARKKDVKLEPWEEETYREYEKKLKNGTATADERMFLLFLKRKKRGLLSSPHTISIKGISLKVAEAPQMDVGLGRARIDVNSRLALGVEVGDVIEIEGKRITAAIYFRARQEDEGKGIIRIDGHIRRNAKVTVGDKVKVRKAEPVDAKKIVIAPIIAKNQRLKFGEGIEHFIKNNLLKRPVVEGDEIVVPGITLMGRTGIIFKVIKCIPPKGILQIGMDTEIEVKEEVPRKSEEEIPTGKVLEEEKRKVERVKDDEELERERKIIDDWDSITSDAKRLWFLKKYWHKIADAGLEDFLRSLGIKTTTKVIDKFSKVLYDELKKRYPETIREWFITKSPDAKFLLYIILLNGVHSSLFLDGFIRWYNDKKKEMEKELDVKLPPAEEAYDAFRDFIISYRV